MVVARHRPVFPRFSEKPVAMNQWRCAESFAVTSLLSVPLLQAVHDFFERVASGKADLADLGVVPAEAEEGEMKGILYEATMVNLDGKHFDSDRHAEVPREGGDKGERSRTLYRNHKVNSRRTTYRLDISYLGDAFEVLNKFLPASKRG
jgi:hypothetical protein